MAVGLAFYSVFFLRLPLLWPWFESWQRHFKDWVCIPYIILSVFFEISLWGFPPASEIITSFLVFSIMRFLSSVEINVLHLYDPGSNPGSDTLGTGFSFPTWFFFEISLWGFPPAFEIKTSFLVFSIMRFLASVEINVTFPRILCLTTRINK